MRAIHRKPRGFTLVELLVAITAGTFVAAAAVMLAKNAVRLFQEEARTSHAQISVATGLERLGADIVLAGRKSSPDILRDPRVCAPAGLSGFPAGLRRLAPVVVEEAAWIPDDAAKNQMKPERITISGDLESGERFDVRAVAPGPSGLTVYLQPRSAAVRRIEALRSGKEAGARLAEIFRVGRILRIDGGMFDYYGVVAGLSLSGNPPETIAVSLSPSPEVPLAPQSPLRCAGRGFFSGKSVNVVSRVRYELRSIVGDALYASWIGPPNPVAGDLGRSELVRVELDADEQEIPDTLRVVAEHAVDLRFGLTALSPASTPDAPVLLRLPISDIEDTATTIHTIAGSPTNPSSNPGAVRAVSVRLSVRLRAPDRSTPITSPPGRPYRFEVGGALGPDRFARVRTFEREFFLKNARDGGSP